MLGILPRQLARPTHPRPQPLRHGHGNCWALLSSCLLVLGALTAAGADEPPRTAAAQPTARAEYQVYALRFKQAAEVEPIVSEMIGGISPGIHVVCDSRTNQLLVRGPQTVQQVVADLVAKLDRPQPAAASQKPVLKSYACPLSQVDACTEQLRRRYEGSGARIAGDRNTGQILVLAPQSLQDEIAAQVQAIAGQGTEAAAWPISGGVPAPSNGPTPGQVGQRASGFSPPEQASPAARQELFVELFHVAVEPVESALQQILPRTMQPLGTQPGAGRAYLLSRGDNQQVRITVDAANHGFWVAGTANLVRQVAELIGALDRPKSAGDWSVRVVAVQQADRVKVQQVIRAYQGLLPAGSGGQGPNWSTPPDHRPAAPASSQQPPDGSGAAFGGQYGGIQLVQHLAPMLGATSGLAAGQVPGGAPGIGAPPQTGGQPMGQEELPDRQQALPPAQLLPGMSDVEIETLPDLDVIILRGRQRDVDELTRIIAELERLSAETQPAIDIYRLRHVNCQALAELIEQVDEELVGGRQGRASVIPLVKPNALLLIGWGDAVAGIKELVAKLDQPVDPQTQLRVFRLRRAPASNVQTTIRGAFVGREGLAPQVQAVVDARTNSLIVRAAPRDMAEVALLIEQLEGHSEAVNQARIFKLNNTLAADLAATLRTAIAAGAGAGEKSAVLELLGIDRENQRVLRSGILADVQITPDPHTNTLIVSAPAESLELVAELIKQLDSPTAVAQIKVFRIFNGDASAMAQMLQNIFPRQPGAGPQLAGAEGETTLVPVRFSVDVRTNSIIATGSKGDLAIVEALLLRLDEEEVAQRVNTIYRLRNAPAVDVARSINDFLRSERQLQAAAPGVLSPFEQIEREVIVVPELVSNALIISATPRFFDEIMKLVERLDEQPPQVMIQVLIAEVKLNNTDEFGVEMGLQDSVLFDRSLLGDLITTSTTFFDPISGQRTSTTETIVSATNEPGYNFNNQPLGNSGSTKALANSSKTGTQGLTHFALGRINNNLTYGGLVLSASSENISILIRALEETRRVDVLARPQVMTLDNQPAFIQVGKRVPRIVGTRFDGRTQVNTVELEPVGLILAVTPRISPDGSVVMEIDAEKSDLGPESEGIPISITEGTVIRSPAVLVTTAQTTVSAAHGETIVLGGLITKDSETVKRRVPLLADIPILGQAFQYNLNQSTRSELLIILTPYIIRGPEDVERIKNMETARMSWTLSDVHQVHGPIGVYGEEIMEDQTMVIYPDLNPRGTPPQGAPTIAPPETKRPTPETAPSPAPGGEPTRSGMLFPGTTPPKRPK